MHDFPKIVSVDDHVVEPPDVWSSRLPARYRDVGPRVVHAPKGEVTFVGGRLTVTMGAPGSGPDVAWWRYEDLCRPLMRLDAAVGFDRDEVDLRLVRYDQMRPGAFMVADRLADMDVNHIESSLCFPTFPRFCGQTFTEAADRELALLCVRAYNDWMVEEWCGAAAGRLIPLAIVPLWDAGLAAAEVRRNAARGVRAVCFSEIPPFLGLPSIHDRDHYWDPFFAACAETGTTINMHIGSSSKMPSTSADAPPAVGSTLTFANSCYSLVDWLLSGTFERFPELTIAYSEGSIGWIPYILHRADVVWRENRGWGGLGETVTVPPSELYRRHVYGCFFDDPHGLLSLDEIGADTVTYESDYPHSDSTWPDTRAVAERQMKHLPMETIEKIVRGNAIRMLGLTPDGRWAAAPDLPSADAPGARG
ncbi:amidohydrolase [Frankia sp. R43]|uniref:amidohydrolase family protein n=1 Tax=Frankia sp. R43 TaxID=269536 RepID=UPI0006CA13B4|nr:amidohydrolase family protein [Frankia sp. R43]KPM56577.1 amidohydrolase [Frankia sp. R43]